MSACAASRVIRRALSGAAAKAGVSQLQAIKVDNGGRAWRLGVHIGRKGGEGLLANLHPRDAPLLERTGSFGDTPATLTTRPGMLIVRFQCVSAVIGTNCVLLMGADRASPKAAAGAIAASVSQHRDSAHHPPDYDARVHASLGGVIAVDDFPLRALECILDEATGYYHQKLRRIKLLTEYCLETITDELKSPGWGPGASEAGFQRLLPLRRAMAELESDIREAHHALSDAMRSDDRVDTLLPRCSRLAYSAAPEAPASAAGAQSRAHGGSDESSRSSEGSEGSGGGQGIWDSSGDPKPQTLNPKP